jgi:hypothetical protein
MFKEAQPYHILNSKMKKIFFIASLSTKILVNHQWKIKKNKQKT